MRSITWAHEHFWGETLGDIRLQRRAVELAACIKDNPHGTLPQAIRECAPLKAAYRLLNNEKVTHGKMLDTHTKATRKSCREPGDYLMIEDTTALSFTQRAPVEGMGPLTKSSSQGLLAHTCLATRIARWSTEDEPEVSLVGVLGQACWAREEPQGTRAERKKTKRIQKAKGDSRSESERWGRALREAGPVDSGVRWTLVADRECDIFQVLFNCAQGGHDWVVRASQARNTTSDSGNVFATAANAPVLGRFGLALRARPGVAARLAELEVRAISTQIVAPRCLPGEYVPQRSQLVQVREVDSPAHIKPLHWVLLTSWPCDSFVQARRVVGAYATRWLIEEYHKALKTGTNIEESQLSRGESIKTLLAIHTVVAVDLIQLKLLANTHPDEPITNNLLSKEASVILEKQFGIPDGPWTNEVTMCAIARMGGYLARKHDGPPGWLSIWRGWLRLEAMVDGYRIALARGGYG